MTKKSDKKKKKTEAPEPKKKLIAVVDNFVGRNLQIQHATGSFKLRTGRTENVAEYVYNSPHFKDLAQEPNPSVALSFK